MRRTIARLGVAVATAAALPLAVPAVASAETPGDLVISEIMQNPSAVGDSAGEWFEITNVSATDVDIDGWTIADNDSDSHTIANGGALVVPAGGQLVLGNNADTSTNGGAAVDYVYSGIALANGADELVLTDASGTEFDRVEWDGGPGFPDPNGASMNLDAALVTTTANDAGSNWCEATAAFGAGDSGSPGAANEACDTGGGGGGGGGATAAFIHDVQGSGASVVPGDYTVEAVVIGDFQLDDQLDGFFIQEEDADADADPTTSEGIFVYCGNNCPVDVAEGDLVQVTGSASDFFGMSQLTATGAGDVVVLSSGAALPTPAVIDLPIVGDVDAFHESLEGMRVTYSDTLVVSEYFAQARYGQVVLYPGARPYQYTQLDSTPTVAEYQAHLDALDRSRVILDDDDNTQNSALPDGIVYHPAPAGFSLGTQGVDYFRGGDEVQNLTGVLHWSFAGQSGTDAWRIRPTAATPATFTPANARTGVPAVGGSMTVASFNVLNYFTTIDTGSPACGPSGTLDCRGANSEAERVRQLDKIAAALSAMDADVVGVIEIENNASASLQSLVSAVPGYDYVDTGTIGSDAIKVGFIYKSATVTPVGAPAVLDSSVDPTFIDDKNRPALAQTFEELSTGGQVTVVVNHLKSKGSDCDALGDPDAGDGQGNCNGTRAAAATAIANWLAGDPTGSGDADVLIIGDLNAYAGEDPINNLLAAGYTDELQANVGPDAYGYLFDGQLGTLDYALSSASLASQVTGAATWSINADEVNLFDYQDGIVDPGEASFNAKPTGNPLYAPDAYRASDHDPVLVGLALTTPVPMCNGLVATIVGTAGDDVLIGTNGPDVIVGLGGNDIIKGRRGNDVICGGDGDDVLRGGRGADTLLGEGGDDTVKGGKGNDTIDGGDGDDTLKGNSGRDVIDGGDGNDDLRGHSGRDTLNGGDGDDYLAGNSGRDTLNGGDGDDTLKGGWGRDALDGGPGTDGCNGGWGWDTSVNCENGCPAGDTEDSDAADDGESDE